MYLDPICTYTLTMLCPRFLKGLIWLSSILVLNSGTRYLASVDCLQSAFSLKIRLVIISASAIGNHDAMLQQGFRTRREKTVSYYFFSGLRPRLLRLACPGRGRFACLAFVNLQRKIRDCSQSRRAVNFITFYIIIFYYCGICLLLEPRLVEVYRFYLQSWLHVLVLNVANKCSKYIPLRYRGGQLLLTPPSGVLTI